MTGEPLVRTISDTALWVAVYRARESARPDALFRDPFARRLAGTRGEQISETLGPGGRHDWAFVIRTVSFDALIEKAIRNGVDTVVNLAAGLETRPYRMDLPPHLRWFEVDLPEIIDYKERILAGAELRCQLTRTKLDLGDGAARRAFLADVDRGATRTMVITEGLLIYLVPDDVAALAHDLGALRSFQFWLTDLASPGLLRMLQREYGHHLNDGAAPLRFAPANGVALFESLGWRAKEIRSNVKQAARARRGPFFLRIVALFPDRPRNPGNQPWSAAVLLERF